MCYVNVRIPHTKIHLHIYSMTFSNVNVLYNPLLSNYHSSIYVYNSPAKNSSEIMTSIQGFSFTDREIEGGIT